MVEFSWDLGTGIWSFWDSTPGMVSTWVTLCLLDDRLREIYNRLDHATDLVCGHCCDSRHTCAYFRRRFDPSR